MNKLFHFRCCVYSQNLELLLYFILHWVVPLNKNVQYFCLGSAIFIRFSSWITLFPIKIEHNFCMNSNPKCRTNKYKSKYENVLSLTNLLSFVILKNQISAAICQLNWDMNQAFFKFTYLLKNSVQLFWHLCISKFVQNINIYLFKFSK
jgi:hypothetical protein